MGVRKFGMPEDLVCREFSRFLVCDGTNRKFFILGCQSYVKKYNAVTV